MYWHERIYYKMITFNFYRKIYAFSYKMGTRITAALCVCYKMNTLTYSTVGGMC